MSETVSVIIPSFNRARFLPDAVASVRASHYPVHEIIIVDDGSTDNTPAVIAGLGADVRGIYQPNRGPAAARNTGIRAASGSVLAFLDADDLWTPLALDHRMEALLAETDPPRQIVSGFTQRVKIVLDSTPPGAIQSVDPPWPAFSFGSAVTRRGVYEQIGLQDETLLQSEDVDWFLRVREQKVPLIFIDRVTQLYRLHGTNITFDTASRDFYNLRAYKKSIVRRTRVHDGIPYVEPFVESEDVVRALSVSRFDVQ